jgi:predicted RNA-binding Zn-ribbon protein involved in translation (DUF1610 family)
MYKICPSCDYFSNTEQKEKFCLKCGTQLSETCTQCGKEITNPYARNCPNCGAAYRASESSINNKITSTHNKH